MAETFEVQIRLADITRVTGLLRDGKRGLDAARALAGAVEAFLSPAAPTLDLEALTCALNDFRASILTLESANVR